MLPPYLVQPGFSSPKICFQSAKGFHSIRLDSPTTNHSTSFFFFCCPQLRHPQIAEKRNNPIYHIPVCSGTAFFLHNILCLCFMIPNSKQNKSQHTWAVRRPPGAGVAAAVSPSWRRPITFHHRGRARIRPTQCRWETGHGTLQRIRFYYPIWWDSILRLCGIMVSHSALCTSGREKREWNVKNQELNCHFFSNSRNGKPLFDARAIPHSSPGPRDPGSHHIPPHSTLRCTLRSFLHPAAWVRHPIPCVPQHPRGLTQHGLVYSGVHGCRPISRTHEPSSWNWCGYLCIDPFAGCGGPSGETYYRTIVSGAYPSVFRTGNCYFGDCSGPSWTHTLWFTQVFVYPVCPVDGLSRAIVLHIGL